MDKNVKFSKVAFGGFNKTEVLEYIDELVNDFQGNITAVEEENALYKSQIEENQNQIAELKEVVETQYAELINAKNEASSLNQENIKLSVSEKNTRTKLDMFEKAASSAKDILTRANEQSAYLSKKSQEDAAAVIEVAKQEAQKILDQAEQSACETRQSAKKQANEVLEQFDEIEEKSKKLIEDAKQESQNILQDAHQKILEEKQKYNAILKDKQLLETNIINTIDEIRLKVTSKKSNQKF